MKFYEMFSQFALWISRENIQRTKKYEILQKMNPNIVVNNEGRLPKNTRKYATGTPLMGHFYELPPCSLPVEGGK